MAMLYLTPVLPLGLVSYMCGTTAMDLYSFAIAKIASLPLYLMYAFMGASAHSFIKGGKGGGDDIGKSLTDESNKLDENQFMIVSGLVLSIVMMTLITRTIKKELMKVRCKCTREVIKAQVEITAFFCTLLIINKIQYDSCTYFFLIPLFFV